MQTVSEYQELLMVLINYLLKHYVLNIKSHFLSYTLKTKSALQTVHVIGHLSFNTLHNY